MAVSRSIEDDRSSQKSNMADPMASGRGIDMLHLLFGDFLLVKVLKRPLCEYRADGCSLQKIKPPRRVHVLGIAEVSNRHPQRSNPSHTHQQLKETRFDSGIGTKRLSTIKPVENLFLAIAFKRQGSMPHPYSLSGHKRTIRNRGQAAILICASSTVIARDLDCLSYITRLVEQGHSLRMWKKKKKKKLTLRHRFFFTCLSLYDHT